MSEQVLSNYYSELNRLIQKNEHEKIVKTANKVLHSFHSEFKAFQCKIVSLINLDRFDEVLTAFVKYPEFAKEMLFEKAYTLYRLSKVNEALEVIDSSVEKNKLNFLELKAQIYYRLEKYDESFELYKNIVKQSVDEYDDERKTNLTANIANLANKESGVDIFSFCSERGTNDTYEVLFNIACYLINLKKYSDAEQYLTDSEKICSDSFEEDTPQDEIDEELHTIKIQYACCKHFQGKENQALNIYKAILDKKPSDSGVIAVANNNILAVDKNKNVFELKKKVKFLQSESVISKLTSAQKGTIATNINQINALTVQSKEQALSICDKLIAGHPENVETVLLLKTAIFIKYKELASAITILENQLKKSTGSKLKMGLAIAQLYLNMGKYDKACEALHTLGEDMFRPGVVSALVTIMTALGDSAGAAKVLQSAVDWNKKDNKVSGDLKALWQHASDLHLKRGQSKLAAHSLEELLKIKPKDLRVLSKLTIAYAKFDPSRAFVYCNAIQSSIDLTPDLDVGYLESSSWMMGLKAIKKVGKMDQSPGTPFIQKNKKSHNSKKRKRFPKNYDPQVTPDPERWLPRRERSNFKKKKDRRNKDIGRGTQGSSSASADQYDITKMSGAIPKDKAGSTSAASPSDESSKLRNKLHQRKKKKGSKW